MKKILKVFCICLALLCCFICTACFTSSPKHETVYYNPEHNGGKYKFEITVTKVANNYRTNIWVRGLVATIEIKTKTSDDVNTDWLLKLYDFEFYLTEPVTIYETYMYVDSYEEKLTELALKPQTTTKLYLRIDYDDSTIDDDEELDYYEIKLWGLKL